MTMNKDFKVKIENGQVAGRDLDEIGRNLVANMTVFDLLSALSRSYEDRELNPMESQAQSELIDLMAHFDPDWNMQQEVLEVNPLTLIRRLWLSNLLDVKEAGALKDKFNAHVKDALGTTLEEEQVQALFELLHGFNIGDELAEMRGETKTDLKPSVK